MPSFGRPADRKVISGILKEITIYHSAISDIEHILEIVVHEAQQYGISPFISAPIARNLLKKSPLHSL